MPAKYLDMDLRTGLMLLTICLESQVGAMRCSKKIDWGEIVTVPKDQTGHLYKNNLHCTYQANFAKDADIEPNVQLLSWFTFDIEGEMPNCRTDYLEIYVR